MMPLRPLGFRFRLWLAAMVPALLITAVFVVIASNWTLNVLESSLRERVEAVGRQLAAATEFHLYTGDVANMASLVKGLAQEEPEIIGVAIFDRNGALLVRQGSEPLAFDADESPVWRLEHGGSWMRLMLPIVVTPVAIDDFSGLDEGSRLGTSAGERLGYLGIRVSLESVHARHWQIVLAACLAFLVAALLGSALSVWLSKSVTDPLGVIISVVERIGHGNLAARIPLDENCVLAPLVKGINEMAAEVAVTQEEMRQRIEKATQELQRQKLDAEQAARIDPLTGLNNRRAFFEFAERDLRRAVRYDFPMALIMLDIDHFKSINDLHGHPVGDRVLVALAGWLTHAMREVDVIGRLGGEEFAILMPDTTLEAAAQAAERLREAIAGMTLDEQGQSLSFTASFGVSMFNGEADTINALIARADKALYLAKRLGRNRVEIFGDYPSLQAG